MNAKNKLILGIAALLFLTTVAGFTLFILKSSENKTLRDKNQNNAISFEATQQSYLDIQSDLEDQIEEHKSNNMQLEKDIEALTADKRKYFQKYLDLSTKINCKIYSDKKINTSSHSTVAEGLKEIVGDQYGKVESNTWDMVWNNAKTAIHKLNTSEFLVVFIVDFEDAALGKDTSIYWVDGQCFIDLDQ
jgi:hypothetical protein